MPSCNALSPGWKVSLVVNIPSLEGTLCYHLLWASEERLTDLHKVTRCKERMEPRLRISPTHEVTRSPSPAQPSRLTWANPLLSGTPSLSLSLSLSLSQAGESSGSPLSCWREEAGVTVDLSVLNHLAVCFSHDPPSMGVLGCMWKVGAPA